MVSEKPRSPLAAYTSPVRPQATTTTAAPAATAEKAVDPRRRSLSATTTASDDAHGDESALDQSLRPAELPIGEGRDRRPWAS